MVGWWAARSVWRAWLLALAMGEWARWVNGCKWALLSLRTEAGGEGDGLGGTDEAVGGDGGRRGHGGGRPCGPCAHAMGQLDGKERERERA